MTVKLLDKAGLKAKGIGWNASTLWRKTVSGDFPKAVVVGNRNMWLETEVDQYIQHLIDKRGTGRDGREVLRGSPQCRGGRVIRHDPQAEKAPAGPGAFEEVVAIK